MPVSRSRAADDFDYLVALTDHAGPHLQQLFQPKNLKAAAALFIVSEPRYRHMELMLKAFKWPERAEWSASVLRIAKTSVEDFLVNDEAGEALKEKLDAARDAGRPILVKGRPVEIAEAFHKAMRPHLVHVDGLWLDYRGDRYDAVVDLEVSAAVQEFLTSGVDSKTGEDYVASSAQVHHGGKGRTAQSGFASVNLYARQVAAPTPGISPTLPDHRR